MMESVGSALARASRRTKLGRKLSRRLSLVTKVPSLIGVRLKQELGSRDSLGGTTTPKRFGGRNKTRSFDITVIAPDKTQRILTVVSPLLISEMVSPILLEFGLGESRLRLAGSLAVVDAGADVSLLEGDVLLVEDANRYLDPRGETDSRFLQTEALLLDETEYATALGSVAELYGGPLRKLCSLQEEEHYLLFGGLADLARESKELCAKMKEVLETWDPDTSRIGNLFSKQLWSQYEEYQEMYRRAKELLREKNDTDDEFVEFCKLRRGAAKDSLETLLDLPVQRLAQYEQYFQSILCDGRHDHPDHEDVSRAKAKAKQAVIRSQEESDLERIQDLFPNDCLRLYDKDVLTMKMKGLIRKRSTTAARLQRALSAKSLRPDAGDESPPGRQEKGSPDKRQFLMEAPVQFTTGVQSQDRHLFLFSDLLLVAKARSGGNFKLKEKVRVSELWLTRCAMDDVIEVNKAVDTSFVIGWPTTNVVATFTTQAARDLWWTKLNEVVNTEKEKEPSSTNIQVVYYDLATNIEYCKTFSVGPDETARCCVRLALEHLDLRAQDVDGYQLWARTARDEAPYPLIGHERPFAIKLSTLRHGLSSEEGFDLDHCNNVHGPDPLPKCQFILSKRKCNDCPQSLDLSGKKNNNKKNRKTPLRIREVFKRSLSKDGPMGQLFGRPLSSLCLGENLPKPVMAMLHEVFAKGPQTQGIFRKSANARLVRELRDRLDEGAELATECLPVLVTASLLKDFLRSLPDPLLGSALYPLWMEALECPDEQEKLARIKSVLDQLPRVNVNLLCHFLCVMHHVARRSAHNLMSAANLGVCVGPSLLWAPGPSQAALTRAVPTLIELLISRCEILCGPHVPHLLGEPPDTPRQDSGAEESDSLHSGGLRRDDSSIDSLERELLEPPRKDKMSLSRDSGLTLSDSQLYTPDEEESGSTSSGSLYPPTHTHTKVSSSYSMPPVSSTPVTTPMREYVRVYGGWEERVQECRTGEDSIYARQPQPAGVMNPNFQRRDWFRQRSHLKRVNSGGTNSSKSSQHMSGSSSGSSSSGVGGLHRAYATSSNNLLRRSASEESLLDGGDVECYDEETGGMLIKRPALHRKGRAPPPPNVYSTESAHNRYNMTRSKSSHHLVCSYAPLEEQRPQEPRTVAPTDARWRSTPHIAAPEEAERSYDSSTLSDDDSTPHVSRSNSRGKDCAAANSAWESAYGPSTELIVHAAPVNIEEEGESERIHPVPSVRKNIPLSIIATNETTAPPLPPKRSPTDVKLRHLPPVHVDGVRTPLRPQSCYVTTEETRQWEEPDTEPRKAPERRGRLRRRDENSLRERSKSLPPPPSEKEEVVEKSEVPWSVSKLSALFGGSRPPPYRPPPRVIPSHRAPITAFHLGVNTQSERFVASRRLLLAESADEEESYV